MSSIFISHASADRYLVEQVFLGLLRALGFETWFAPDDIRSSEKWEQAIFHGLESSEWLILLMSKEATLSSCVKKEVHWAFENLPNRIIPILIDDCDPASIDGRLLSLQHLDYGADSTRAIHKLVEHLVKSEYAGFQRHLTGEWISAVQPVYYPAGNKWHVQEVRIVPSSHGYVVHTVLAAGKLQWRLEAKLVANSFLVGRWFSKRESSQSQGYMSLQIARNGLYMFGHDYGIVFEEVKAQFGILLFARDEKNLDKAWTAMKTSRREMLPLDCRINFPDVQ